MNTEKTMLILGAGIFQVPLIQAARERGYRTVVSDINEQAPGVSLCDTFLKISTHDAPPLIRALEEKNLQPSVAGTLGTDFTLPLSIICRHFNLAGPVPEQAEVLTDKYRMRQFLKNHRFTQPAFTAASEKQSLQQWVRENPSDKGFVIKPLHNMGARGVMYFSHIDELGFSYEAAAGASRDGRVILEHFVEAHELSSDALVINGQAHLTGLADRIINRKDNRYFIETGHTMPAENFESLADPVSALMQQIADSLSELSTEPYTGALKGDLRLTAGNKIIIGEVAGRLSGGFMSTHTYPAASGHSLVDAYIDILEGRTPQFISEKKNNTYPSYAFERALTGPAGALARLKLPDKPAFIDHIQINIHEGEKITDLRNNTGKILNITGRAPAYAECDSLAGSFLSSITLDIEQAPFTAEQIRKTARKKFNHDYCWVCRECDGRHCASAVPGMGAPGRMLSFTDNITSLAEYRIQPSYFETDEAKKPAEPDTSLDLFGYRIAAPLLSAPITGAVTNMGGSLTEWDYAIETGSAAVSAGLMPTFGDGASEDKYRTGIEAIRTLQRGIPVFKPRSQQHLIARIRSAADAGATAWGIDIDGFYFRTMNDRGQITERKTPAHLRELAAVSELPFLVKGVFSRRDIDLALEAGAPAIIISNHGGRVLDDMPGTFRVLKELAAYARSQSSELNILADGGIRSGSDIFKMLAHGADAVLIGRPVVIAAVAGGRSAVYSLLNRYTTELKDAMRLCGLSHIEQINEQFLCSIV